MPYTLETLYRKTPKLRRISAQYVKITRLKYGYTKRHIPYAACQSFSTHHILPSGRVIRAPEKIKYITVIEVLDRKLHCKCSCSCPDFTFSGAEWVLTQHGSADIEYGDGKSPDIKNPSGRPLLCKHLVALYLKIKPRL